ncbi:MAG: ABC1 kinase family protein, partial [Sharpea porci]
PIQEVFSSINKEPLGSASIAQVHEAFLLSGEKVVVKVQRPYIYETMEADIKLLRQACKILKLVTGTGDLLDFRAVIEELWRTSQIEMDFFKEADNIDHFALCNQDINYILVPHVYHEYTTRHLIVMNDVGNLQIDHVNELKNLGYDIDDIAKKTAENFVKQILDDGFFHADPHPGNIHVTDNKIAWIDFGMMGTVTPSTQQILTKGIKAVLDDDIYDLEEAFLMLTKPEQKINEGQLIYQLNMIVEKYKQRNFGDFDFGPLIEGCIEIVKTNKIAVPADLTLLLRAMLTINGTLGEISPTCNLIEILANHMRIKWQKELDLKTQMMHIIQSLYTSSKKGIATPSIVYDLLKLAKNGHITLNIKENKSDRDLRLEKHNWNHIVIAIVSGFFYLSASILTLSPLEHSVFGMPLLSFIGYVVGTILVVMLLWRLEHDQN